MQNDIESTLLKINNTNRVLWLGVFISMFILILITLVLYYTNLIELTSMSFARDFDRIVLMLIFVITLIIFYIKRSYLIPGKLVEKANKIDMVKNRFLSGDNADLKLNTLNNAIFYCNRYMLIVWFLADFILIAAFVNFIIAPILNTFIIYGVVALYSLAINYPTYRHLKSIYSFIYE